MTPWCVMPFDNGNGGVVVCRHRDDVTTLLVVLRLWLEREGLRELVG